MSKKPRLVQRLVRPALVPRAWAVFAENGNCIIWSTKMETVKGSADFYGRPVTPLYDLSSCPVALMDTRAALSVCALKEEDFPSLYALQGHRVALVDLGPNTKLRDAAPKP